MLMSLSENKKMIIGIAKGLCHSVWSKHLARGVTIINSVQYEKWSAQLTYTTFKIKSMY